MVTSVDILSTLRAAVNRSASSFIRPIISRVSITPFIDSAAVSVASVVTLRCASMDAQYPGRVEKTVPVPSRIVDQVVPRDVTPDISQMPSAIVPMVMIEAFMLVPLEL